MTLVLLATPIDANAQGSGLKLPASIYIAAHAIDVHSTHLARANGGVEANPLMDSSTSAQIAIKAMTSVTAIWIARGLERDGHPRIAKYTLYALASVTSAVAVHNYRVARR